VLEVLRRRSRSRGEEEAGREDRELPEEPKVKPPVLLEPKEERRERSVEEEEEEVENKEE
jgi:hypothetical protein